MPRDLTGRIKSFDLLQTGKTSIAFCVPFSPHVLQIVLRLLTHEPCPLLGTYWRSSLVGKRGRCFCASSSENIQINLFSLGEHLSQIGP